MRGGVQLVVVVQSGDSFTRSRGSSWTGQACVAERENAALAEKGSVSVSVSLSLPPYTYTFFILLFSFTAVTTTPKTLVSVIMKGTVMGLFPKELVGREA